MSWLADFTPGAEERRQKAAAEAQNDPTPRVRDSSGREVPLKQANKPFLAYQEYRKKQEQELEARKKRNKERLEKIARGETVGPAEKEDLEEEIGLWGLIKFLIIVVACVMLAGHFITGDYLWDYKGKYRHIKTYWPTGQTLFSESQLAKFDGTKEHFGVYVAIMMSTMYLQIAGHMAQEGHTRSFTIDPRVCAAWQTRAGKDAARAFATGCFKEHQTHDIRGLDEDEQRRLAHWKKFFAEHKDYPKVGRVVHPPIDPASPIPADCDPEAKQKRAEARAKAKEEEASAATKSETQGPKNSHQEL